MIDPFSPTWRAVAAMCNEVIEISGRALASIGATERNSDLHRGQIAMARRILAQVEQDTGED